MSEVPRGKRILLDSSAQSANEKLPAFLARPAGTPIYHGFPIIEESATDGWYLGTITDYADPKGCEFGDAFVIAPDGRRAGLVWAVGDGSIELIMPPEPDRWGVYALWFPQPIHDTEEFIAEFRRQLPALKTIYLNAVQQRGHESK
jgi:hypothetical protein